MSPPVRLHHATSWQRLARKAREVGPAYLGQLLFQRLIPRSLLRVRTLLIFSMDLRHGDIASPEDPEVRWATPDDLDRLARRGKGATGLRTRLDSGARAVVAERHGRLVGEGWYRPVYCDMDDWLRFTAPRDCVWMISVWVAPEHRGQRLHPRMKMLGAAHYANAGYSRILTWIEALNRNSQRGSAKTGSRPIGRVRTVRFLGFGGVFFDGRLRVGRWNPRRVLELPVDPVIDRAAADGAQQRDRATLTPRRGRDGS